MRKIFIETLVELAEKDSRVLLLSGDIGYMALEPFAERFPGRYFNCGVAEQNMLGVATGLAEAGFIPFVYSIATFSALRPYDFIRNGPVLHNLPVRIVGVGGGFEYGHNGITHYALEDVAVMRTFPNMTVLSPADYGQARAVLLNTWDIPGPAYYRLGKDADTVIPGLNSRFERGRVQVVASGGDLLILAMGAIAKEAAAAGEILRGKRLACTVAVVAEVNPAPTRDIALLLKDFKTVITVEAHYLNGGLGSLVAETIAEHGLTCKLLRRGVKAMPAGFSGSEAHMNRSCGLDRVSLAQAALELAGAKL